MKVYPTSKIRNVALVGHVGSGKTSLAEAMLFNAGHTTRLGKVDDGTTTTDFHPEETKRKITINATLAPIEWKDHKINLIDAPGFADFYAEVKGAMRAVDSLIVVLDGVGGVEVQTEVVWEDADKRNLPRIAYINKIERENANFFRVIDQMKESLTGNIVPIQLPIGSEASFSGVVDLLKMKAYQWEANGKFKEVAIPAELVDDAAAYRDQLAEAAAEADDDLLNKFLEGEELSTEEIYTGFKAALRKGMVIPVLCGSATKNIGIQLLLDLIIEGLPSPNETAEAEGKDLAAEPLTALVFKTLTDPYVGKLNFFRVFTGTFKGDTFVYNANKEKEEKIGQILIMRGKNQETVPELHAGDIAAVAKLTETTTGDTFCQKGNPVILEGVEFPEPRLSIAIEPKSKGDEDKLGTAITRLMEEDPSLRWSKNVETRQTLLTGMGETHLDIVLERLQRKFGVEVTTKEPKVAYRETIRGTVKVEGKHKKQTGGHGQYGHVWLEISPNYDAELEFSESLFGGSVPKQYVPAVEKGVREGMQEGVLAGFPVTGLKVNLYDGSYHTVDSNELSFKMAAILALRKGLKQAKPVLLEPIASVEVTVPEQFMGDIIGDLNTKRGRILGMEPHGKYQIIKAQVPASEMQRYAIDLKSITQGRGSFSMEITGYEEVPSNLAEKIIAARKAEKEE
ncbi:MAG: elongation factor G [Syntrophomonadaceae bacterium]|nr:elongation factor G [Syntrophomonadaceae bacterium]